MPLVYRCKATYMPTELQTNFRSRAYIDSEFFSAMHHWRPSVYSDNFKPFSFGGLTLPATHFA